jgi:hypothetical protein
VPVNPATPIPGVAKLAQDYLEVIRHVPSVAWAATMGKRRVSRLAGRCGDILTDRHLSQGGAMAKPIGHLIERTPSGVKIDLKRLYVYPDGHANLVFADGTNWPIADPYEVIQLLAGELLRPMEKRARQAA